MPRTPNEITTEAIAESMATVKGWYEMRQEVLRYLALGMDNFTVSSGPWTIIYDRKEKVERIHE